MNTCPKHVFTMLELLLVVAIIAILASLLLPALNRAKGQSHKIVCGNNLKQNYTAIMFYVSDNNNWMPRTTRNSVHTSYLKDYLSWAGEVRHYAIVGKEPVGVFWCPAISTAKRSPCWNGDTPKEYYTTSYVPTGTNIEDDHYGGWTYRDTSIGSGMSDKRRFDSIVSGTPILGEQNVYYAQNYLDANTGYNIVFPFYTYLGLDNYRSPAWNHFNSTNFLFKDGHVRPFHWTGSSLFDNYWKEL